MLCSQQCSHRRWLWLAVAVAVVVVSEGGSSVEATEEEVVTKVEAATKEEVATTAEGALVVVEVVEGATVGLEVALMIEAIVGMVEAVVDKTRTILILVVDNQEGGHINTY